MLVVVSFEKSYKSAGIEESSHMKVSRRESGIMNIQETQPVLMKIKDENCGDNNDSPM